MNLGALLGLLLASAPAGAAPSLTVSGELPCSKDELAAALALRVGDGEVRVHGAGDRVRVEVGGRDRVVALDGAQGAAAARRIALAAQDLAQPELPDGAPDVIVVAAAPRTHGARLALTARVGSDELQRGTLALGAEIGRGSVRGVVEGGVSVPASSDPWIVGVPLRAGVAIGDAPTFIVDAVAIPFEISLGTGDRNVIGGAGVEVRGEQRLGPLDLVYEVGVDGFVKQVEYQWHGTALYTTPRVTAWSGLGVRWRAW